MRKKRKDRKARQVAEAKNRKPEEQAGQNAEENKKSPEQKRLPVLWKNSNRMRKWFPIVGAAAAFVILFGIVCGLSGGSEQTEEVLVSGSSSKTKSESRPEASDGNADSLSEERGQIKEQAEEPVETTGEKQKPSAGEDTNQAGGDEDGISVSVREPVPTLSADRSEQNASSDQPMEPAAQPATPAASAAGSGQEPQQVPGHTHHWVEQTETVVHEAVTQQVYVVDQASWEEPVYEEVPVYETYGVEVCGVCGAEMYSSAEVSAHAETHIDWETLENPFYYYTDWRQRQVGTETVQTGTIHHEEQGHYEEQVVQDAYTEVKVTGYWCSICGEER